jgi:hypothetical protein
LSISLDGCGGAKGGMSSTGSDGGGDDYAEFLRVFESVPFANEYTLASNHNDLNRSGFDAASFFEKDADYVEALPGRAA